MNNLEYYKALLKETTRYDEQGKEAKELAWALCRDFPKDSNTIKNALVCVLRG